MFKASQKINELYEVRRKNLEKITSSKEHGNLTAIAKKSNIHPTGLQRIMRGESAFTEKTARAVEISLNLDLTYLDKDNAESTFSPVYLLNQVPNLQNEHALSEIDIGKNLPNKSICIKLTTKSYEPTFPAGSIICVSPLGEGETISFASYYLVVHKKNIPIAEIRKSDGLNFFTNNSEDSLPCREFKIIGKCTAVFLS